MVLGSIVQVNDETLGLGSRDITTPTPHGFDLSWGVFWEGVSPLEWEWWVAGSR